MPAPRAVAHVEHHRRLVARRHEGVAHGAVDVHGLAGREDGRLIDLGVDLDAAAQDVDELLAGVGAHAAELDDRAGADGDQDRHHRLVGEVGAEVAVVVVRGGDQQALAAAGDAAAGGDHRRRGGRDSRVGAEQGGDVDLQTLAELHQLVVGQRQLAVLDLGQGRDGNAGTDADVGQRESHLATDRPQGLAQPGLGRGHARMPGAHPRQPRASTGQRPTSRSPRTQWYQSCRFTLGSQCGTTQTTSEPTGSRALGSGSTTLPK